jgi:hypothetical protein
MTTGTVRRLRSRNQRLKAKPEKTPLQQATESAYRQVFALLDSPFPYSMLLNYIADINSHSFGLDATGSSTWAGRMPSWHTGAR